MLKINTELKTKDGRIIGNAIITTISEPFYIIKSDDIAKAFTLEEINELFYIDLDDNGEINKQVNKPFDFRTIKSFEDACNHLGISREIPTMPSNFISQYKLEIIIKAINNGWKPDFNNKNQPKHYPYFTKDNNGMITYYSYYYNNNNRWLPLGLYLETQEKTEYIIITFTDLYN